MIEQLQRATCRKFQCLPERTAAVAIYTLIGAEPIETTLDKNAMIVFTTSSAYTQSLFNIYFPVFLVSYSKVLN
jgi:hypothetical protein